MTFYVASLNFDVLSVIIDFLLAKNHRENILKRPIQYNAFVYLFIPFLGLHFGTVVQVLYD